MKNKTSVQTFCKTSSIQKLRRTRGFIGIIVLVIIAILLLSYLGFDLKKIFTAPAVKDNFSYVWSFIKNIWLDYLSVPFTFLWSQAVKPVLDLAWKVFMLGIEGIKNTNK